MSQDIFATGRIRKTSHNPLALVEQIAEERGLQDVWESYQEDFGSEAAVYFLEELTDFIQVGTTVYEKVGVIESTGSGYFFQGKPTPDGFEFTTMFYDGGTCLSELLQNYIIENYL